MTQAFADQPVPEWAFVLDHGDYPSSEFLVFGSIVVTIANLLLPERICDKLV